jgi:hypothetical protein
MFARARSKRYFEKIRELIGVQDKAELIEVVRAFGEKLYRPQWHFYILNPAELMDLKQLATTT